MNEQDPSLLIPPTENTPVDQIFYIEPYATAQQIPPLPEALRKQELIGRLADLGRIARIGFQDYRIHKQIEAIPGILKRDGKAINRAGSDMEKKDHETAYHGYLREKILTGQSSIEDRSSTRFVETKTPGNPILDLTPIPRTRTERETEKRISKKVNKHAQAEVYGSMHHRNSGTYMVNSSAPSVRKQKIEIKRQYKTGEINSSERRALLVNTNHSKPIRPEMLGKRYAKSVEKRAQKTFKKVVSVVPREKFLTKLASNQQRSIDEIQTRYAHGVRTKASRPILEQDLINIQARKDEIQGRRQERKNAAKVPLFDFARRASKAVVRGVSSATVKALDKQAAFRQARHNRRSS